MKKLKTAHTLARESQSKKEPARDREGESKREREHAKKEARERKGWRKRERGRKS